MGAKQSLVANQFYQKLHSQIKVLFWDIVLYQDIE